MPVSRMAYWATTVLAGLLFAVPGTALLAKAPHFVTEMARLGYPPYFLTLFGILKILGAAVILAPRLPRLKEWAYAGMLFDAGFAAFSRAAVGDGLALIGPPILIGALTLISWQLRPASRKLISAQNTPPNAELGDAPWQRRA
jgi:uncharacterized membrane protein YphA (DoxX/SURF4 family)